MIAKKEFEEFVSSPFLRSRTTALGYTFLHMDMITRSIIVPSAHVFCPAGKERGKRE